MYLSPERKNLNFAWTKNYASEKNSIYSRQRNSLLRYDSSIKKPFGDNDESKIIISDSSSEFSNLNIDDDSNLKESTPEISPIKNQSH